MPNENYKNLHMDHDGKKYVFNFNGFADVVFGPSSVRDVEFSYGKETNGNLSKLISFLNEHRSSISKDIESKIRVQLPEQINIDVDIRFVEGSLAVVGTAILFGINLISGIEGTIGLFERISKIINFAVDNSVRKAVLKMGARIPENSFRLSIVEPVDILTGDADKTSDVLMEWLKEQSQLSRVILERQNVIQNDVSRLVTLGAILIAILIVLELISIFR